MKYISILFVLVLAGCQTNLTGPAGPSTSLVPNASSIGSSIISDSLGQAPEGIVPIDGINHVSLHADRSLRLEPTCTQVLKLAYSSNINYSEVIMGLKNRALLMGGNAIALVGWAENRTASGMVGKIYICKKKPYHVHAPGSH
ncbi:MAG: hypothetical protein VYE27_03915 [Pseudomonadota bacterium]|nr:hypothetical protein [Pseudomonadota bacterium]